MSCPCWHALSVHAHVLCRHHQHKCRAVLAPGGEVHVAIKVGPPYSRWDIPELAAHAGFVEVRRVPFRASQYPGYHHRTTESGAEALDVDSTAARKLLSTLVFKRRRA